MTGERKYKGRQLAVIFISTQEFSGSLACALTVTDRKDGTTCSQFTVYTDDLPGLQEYVQAHNAGDGEFKVDFHRRRSAERPVATPALQSGVFLQQYPKPV
jgi:hypothetical protein